MTIESGQTLLHYRLVEKIGEGGMGVVWKAVDTSLDRDVAIKILPDNFAADSERLARFEREARVLASLNHPHIAGIYGIHEQSGVRFLSMELVPGEDLSALVDRGPLPVARVLTIAREIAEALEAAHEIGIVHRDLKPANVKLTVDGKAKVLDFGLAKAYDPATASDPDRLQTLTSAGTVAGLIIGTAAYMSPEQASGQPIDRRCDIWSFGVLMYEMLVGNRLFAGETISHTLADVLRAPIELDELPVELPPSIRRLIERCLTRDRMRRLRDIGEARIAIEDAIASPDVVPTGPGPTADPTVAAAPSRLPWILAAAAVGVAALALWSPWADRPAAVTREPVRRFAVEMPNSGSSRQGDGVTVAVSSDGRFVITQGGTGADDMLYLRALDDFRATPITGTSNARNPELSPDDQWVAFLNATGLRKVRVTGGPSVFITQFPSSPDGVHWAADGYVYYAHQGEVWRVDADGGEPERLIENDLTEQPGYGEPYRVAGTSIVLCSERAGPGTQGQLYAFDLESRELTSLDMAGTDPRYLPTGHVLFAQGSQMFLAPFDLRTVRFTGPPEPVLDRAWIDQGQLQLDVSDEGTVAYLPKARGASQTLVAVDLGGKVEPLLPDGLPFTGINDPRISPDGRRVMITVETGAIWMVDLDTQTPTLMTESGFYPLWSPDGDEIVFSTTRNKTFDVYRRPIDLSAPETLLLDLENNARTGDWVADGALVIREEIPGKGMDLRYWPDLEDPASMVPLMEGAEDELAPVVSRDGKWLAYVSNYSGGDEVYVTSFPVAGAKLKISVKGGNSPTWAPDGKSLYYFEDRRLIAVAIETVPTFRVTGRTPLFEGEYIQYRWSRQYDIHPDGKHFVMVQNPPRGNIEVVTRWFDEIRDAAE